MDYEPKDLTLYTDAPGQLGFIPIRPGLQRLSIIHEFHFACLGGAPLDQLPLASVERSSSSRGGIPGSSEQLLYGTLFLLLECPN